MTRVAAERSCTVVVGARAEEISFDRGTIERLLADDRFFWLDLHQPHEDDFAVLREVFRFHPLAVEDSEHFGQRPKLDDYDDFSFLVVYGSAPDEDRLVEVHCFYSQKFLVTVHRDECPAFTALRERYGKRDQQATDPAALLYRIVDALVDSFFPVLAELDDRIDDIEDQIFLKADETQLQEIFGMKRQLVAMRQIITPQRDLFAGVVAGVGAALGLSAKEERYFRDVYDHLIRISDLIDTYRDLLTGALDVYLSTVSNRLNVVMKQLTIIATVFLPLSFLTGFFGQNFGYLVNHIGSWETFVALGLGTEILAVAGLWFLFKRRGCF
jgi:magnesium transporter